MLTRPSTAFSVQAVTLLGRTSRAPIAFAVDFTSERLLRRLGPRTLKAKVVGERNLSASEVALSQSGARVTKLLAGVVALCGATSALQWSSGLDFVFPAQLTSRRRHGQCPCLSCHAKFIQNAYMADFNWSYSDEDIPACRSRARSTTSATKRVAGSRPAARGSRTTPLVWAR